MRSQTWDASLGVNEYGIMLQYIRKFLAKSHPDVGRSGPVCPFVPKSLRKDAHLEESIENVDRAHRFEDVSIYQMLGKDQGM